LILSNLSIISYNIHLSNRMNNHCIYPSNSSYSASAAAAFDSSAPILSNPIYSAPPSNTFPPILVNSFSSSSDYLCAPYPASDYSYISPASAAIRPTTPRFESQSNSGQVKQELGGRGAAQSYPPNSLALVPALSDRMELINPLLSKKLNSACHLCDHAAQRPNRKKIAELIACCTVNCRKVYCSRPGCVKKLNPADFSGKPVDIFSIDQFIEWRSLVEQRKLPPFICPHCLDELNCPGPQCQRRTKRKIQQHLSRGAINLSSNSENNSQSEAESASRALSILQTPNSTPMKLETTENHSQSVEAPVEAKATRLKINTEGLDGGENIATPLEHHNSGQFGSEINENNKRRRESSPQNYALIDNLSKKQIAAMLAESFASPSPSPVSLLAFNSMINASPSLPALPTGLSVTPATGLRQITPFSHNFSYKTPSFLYKTSPSSQFLDNSSENQAIYGNSETVIGSNSTNSNPIAANLASVSAEITNLHEAIRSAELNPRQFELLPQLKAKLEQQQHELGELLEKQSQISTTNSHFSHNSQGNNHVNDNSTNLTTISALSGGSTNFHPPHHSSALHTSNASVDSSISTNSKGENTLASISSANTNAQSLRTAQSQPSSASTLSNLTNLGASSLNSFTPLCSPPILTKNFASFLSPSHNSLSLIDLPLTSPLSSPSPRDSLRATTPSSGNNGQFFYLNGVSLLDMNPNSARMSPSYSDWLNSTPLNASNKTE
jgi:hypothetical protein